MGQPVISPVLQWILSIILSIIFGGLGGAVYSNLQIERRERRAAAARQRQLVSALNTELTRNAAIATINGGDEPILFQTSVLDEALFSADGLALPPPIRYEMESLAIALWKVNSQIRFYEQLRLADYSNSEGSGYARTLTPAGMAANSLKKEIQEHCIGPGKAPITMVEQIGNLLTQLSESTSPAPWWRRWLPKRKQNSRFKPQQG